MMTRESDESQPDDKIQIMLPHQKKISFFIFKISINFEQSK